jgi:16S rRNA (cytosine967-C5)-methyltransferase
MAGSSDRARQAAVALLDGVLGEGQMISALLEDPSGAVAGLEPGDRARAQRLALMVLRHLERAERVLAPHLRKSPPLTVRNVLRLGVVEMLQANAAPHGVVNAAVQITRHGNRTGHMTGLVNAVLRKVGDGAEPGGAAAVLWAKMPPQRLPGWLRKRLVAQYGRPVVDAIERVQMQPPPVDITVKPDVTLTPEELGAHVLPTGSWRLPSGGQISALAGYDAGDWWVQDAAAALPARLLSPAKGTRVLDLCAAPGGKTLQLAAMGAEVTALDISGPRLARLAQNLARAGLQAETVVADALHWQPNSPFPMILLDAPCSATGTIRRHPDLPFLRQETDLVPLIALQSALLDRALALLQPGGILVFCTCSLLPEEGEMQVQAALARHAGRLAVVPVADDGADVDAPLPLVGDLAQCRTSEGGLRLRPDFWGDLGGIDGFYMARLRWNG